MALKEAELSMYDEMENSSEGSFLEKERTQALTLDMGIDRPHAINLKEKPERTWDVTAKSRNSEWSGSPVARYNVFLSSHVA